MELKKSMICIAALAAVFSLSGCKDDTEPGEMTSGITGLYINEVCSGGGSDWIELYNASDKEISLGGMHVQDNKGNEDQYTFPDGASIAAKGFIVLEEGSDFAFGISGDGDEIHLLDEGYAVIDEIIVPAMDDYYTYYRTVDGGNAWDTIYGGTKGRSNTGTPDNPEEGGDNEPVTPEDPTADYTAIKLNELNGNDKFIELYNSSDKAIDFAGVYFTKDGEDTFTVPQNTVIKAGGFLTIWSEKSDAVGNGEIAEDSPYIFNFGLSADKSVMIELFSPDGTSIDIFKNLSKSLGESWGEDDGKYDSKDKGSFARENDGTGDWYIMSATAGKSNNAAEKAEDAKTEW